MSVIQLSVKAKIVLAVGMAVTAVSVVLSIFFYSSFSASIGAAEVRASQGNYDIVNSAIVSQVNLASALASTVANDPTIQEAFANRDREQLAHLTKPIFDELKSSDGLAQFQFHEPNAHSFLRVHKLEKFGDDLSSFRLTVVDANQQRSKVSGIEVGRAGLGLRGVVPMQWQGAHQGTVEMGLSLDKAFLSPFKENNGIESAIYLQRDGAMAKLSSTSAAELLTEEVLQAVYTEKSQHYNVDVNGKSMLMYAAPLLNYSGQAIGVLAVGMDNSARYEADIAVLTNVIMISVVCLLCGGVFAWFVAYRISGPLGGEPHEMEALVNEVASGKLNVSSVSGSGKGVLGSIQGMVEQLRVMVQKVQGSADEANAQASDLSHYSANLNESSNRQATTVAATAKSVALITEALRGNANNASNALELFDSVNSRAVQGEGVVNDAVKAMGQINESSEKAGEIIGVIDEIAFQTNLLALNAAVEAARAGEMGRGFAVVATEVRNLAQRSAKAAQEIKGLLTENVERVDMGSGLVNEAGKMFKETFESVHQLHDYIDKIALATEQQSTALAEISQAMVELDCSATGNSGLSQQTSDAATALRQQAVQLQQLTAHFEVS